MDLYQFHSPKNDSVIPILFSVPHSGTFFPESLRSMYIDEHLSMPQDTDWFVDQIYSFAPDIGAGQIVANYSRYVIDLNRSKNFAKLYENKRHETALVSNFTFSNSPLYKTNPTKEDIQNRILKFYDPYYSRIELELAKLKKSFKNILLIDCHSVKRVVQTIQNEPFKDIILGTVDNTSASPDIIAICEEHFKNGPYETISNNPFKGGNITRNFSQIQKGIHCIQIEMANDLYLEKDHIRLDITKASTLSKHLKDLTLKLTRHLNNGRN